MFRVILSFFFFFFLFSKRPDSLSSPSCFMKHGRHFMIHAVAFYVHTARNRQRSLYVGCRSRENIWVYLLAVIGSIEGAREIFPLTIWHFWHVVKAPSGPSLAASLLPFFPLTASMIDIPSDQSRNEIRWTFVFRAIGLLLCSFPILTRASPADIEFLSVSSFFLIFYLFVPLVSLFFSVYFCKVLVFLRPARTPSKIISHHRDISRRRTTC